MNGNFCFIATLSAMDRSEKREREDGDGFAGGRRVRRRVDEAKGNLDRWQKNMRKSVMKMSIFAIKC